MAGFTSIVVDGILQIIQLGPLFQRHVLSRYYVSEYKVAQLWLPPAFPMGYLHATSFKMVALCLIYAPLYPPAYLFSAAALFFVYLFSK